MKSIMIALVLLASNVWANELVLTSERTKNGVFLDVDLVAGDVPNVVALDYELHIGKTEASVDISDCVGGLPSTHQGQCNMKNGVVKVIVYSTSLDTLGTGNIGSIYIESLDKGINPEIKNVHMSDVQAKEVKFSLLQ